MDGTAGDTAAIVLSQQEPLMGESEVVVNNSSSPSSHLPLQSNNQRTLRFLDGLAIIIGLQIGSGVFSSPAQVITLVPLPLGAVCVWLVAGMIVWAGSSTLLEFATAIPENGGIEEYLRFCYGDAAGFLFAWIWILIAKPCANAMISLILAEHLNKGILSESELGGWRNTGVALLSILVMTFINALGTKAGTRAAKLFLVLKIASVVSITIIGISYGLYHGIVRTQPRGSQQAFIEATQKRAPVNHTLGGGGDIASATFGALFAYGGWENIDFIAGEVQHPERILPKIINTAMILVIIAFLGMNVALFLVLDSGSMSSTNAVAAAFGEKVFGPVGRLTFSMVVVMSCLGALNANLFAAARLTQQAGKRGFIPSYFAKDSQNLVTFWRATPIAYFCRQAFSACFNLPREPAELSTNPRRALMLNSSIASCYILVGTFRGLITFKGMTEYLFYMFTIVGSFILRARMPPGRLSYRTWWPNPIVFSIAAFLLIVRGSLSQPLQGVAICSVILAGAVVYRFLIKPGIKKADEDMDTAL